MNTRSDLQTALTALAAAISACGTAMGVSFGKLNVGKYAILTPQAVVISAGQSANLAINFTPGPDPVAGLQFDLMLPAGFSVTGETIGPAGSSASKQVSSSAVTGGFRFLIFGLNQNAIPEGILLNITLNTDTSVRPGPQTLPLTGIVGAKADGSAGALVAMSAPILIQ